MWGGMDGWGMGIVPGLLWLAILAVGFVVLVRLPRRGAGGGGTADGAEETALDILKKRYARGEIGKEEFEQKKRDLAT